MITVNQVYYSETLVTDELKKNQKYTSGDIEYIVRGADDEEAAIDAVRGAVAKKHLGMRLTSISVSERLDENSWRIRATYDATTGTSNDDGTSRPDYTTEFDFSSTTRHITHSIKTVNSYSKTSQPAIDFGNAINVKKNGAVNEAEGIDIFSPQFQFSETHYFYNRELTTKYKKTLAQMAQKVNNDTFRGYDAGEVLFLGVSGSRAGQDQDDLWALTFKFIVSPNESGIEIGDIKDISKNGWDYAWQYDQDVADVTLKKEPEYAYVEQVYHYDDFKKLGIGT